MVAPSPKGRMRGSDERNGGSAGVQNNSRFQNNLLFSNTVTETVIHSASCPLVSRHPKPRAVVSSFVFSRTHVDLAAKKTTVSDNKPRRNNVTGDGASLPNLNSLLGSQVADHGSDDNNCPGRDLGFDVSVRTGREG